MLLCSGFQNIFQAAQEGCKEVVGRLSQMKNEMQTNKDLQLLQAPQPSNPYGTACLILLYFFAYNS